MNQPINGADKHSPLAGTMANPNAAAVPKQPEQFQFLVPHEAPVFCPTEAEFADPLAYIDKIRPQAERTGICKIKPPPNWQPPFAVDVDKLKFTPRIQRLNELEAKTRVKLNFLDQIAKFWELQGTSLKIPMVEKRALDLYTLHRLVDKEGGFVIATKDRKWSKIATFMGYPQGKGIGTILKMHYERLLFPFEVFSNEKNSSMDSGELTAAVLAASGNSDDKDYKPQVKLKPDISRPSSALSTTSSSAVISPMKKVVGRRGRKSDNNNSSRSNSSCGSRSNTTSPIKVEDGADLVLSGGSGAGTPIKEEPLLDGSAADVESKELKRLQFYGAGPKMAGYNLTKKEDKTRGKIVDFHGDDPLAKYVCHNCSRGDAEEQMLLCDGCDDSYHTFCLMPPVSEIPKGDWCCPKCVAAEVSKPTEAFGFEQAQREYNLQQFGEMADTFKSEYFNMPVHLVPTAMVEKEFWRVVSSIDEDVTVEYGADLHTMDHGSGFPTKDSINLLPGDREYADSGWNLNNLPVLEGSVLGYINADISGMKVPWMYVGMCFATFCWHNEDHWSYSINYLHWGEPKTWYGVPGCKAEVFEETMKSAAPELFHSQPDLLHQLVTIMNPNILMNAGVPVYRTDQHAGEFVITFPRAYHAGFNQGYNFAEAVNFAPADWVHMGRECVLHYSQLRRFCVFSHDELVCKMAANAEILDLTVAAATYKDMLRMVDTEKKLRKNLLDWGVTNAEREAFELLPDDERQCDVCKTTCFMSAITCGCSPDVVVCLRHYASLCKCHPAKRTLRYRYTLDEILPLLRNLKHKAESFDRWADRVKAVLDRSHAKMVDLPELRALLSEAAGKSFPKSELIVTLASAVEDADKCASVIKQLDLNKIRTRHSAENRNKLTMEELTLFCEEIDSLACVLDEEKIIKELLAKTKYFEDEAKRLLAVSMKDCKLAEVESLLKCGSCLCIELPSYRALVDRQSQLRWLRDIYTAKAASGFVADIETLRKLLTTGLHLPADGTVETVLSDLQAIITEAEDWESEANKLLLKTDVDVFTEVEELLKRAQHIDVFLPTEEILIENTTQINGWFKQLQAINSLEFYPYLHVIEDMIRKSQAFAFYLEDVDRLKEFVSSALAWLAKTSRTFTVKQNLVQLMECLSPRVYNNATQVSTKGVGRKKGASNNTNDIDTWTTNLRADTDPAHAAQLFKDAEIAEVEGIRALRTANQTKSLELPNNVAVVIGTSNTTTAGASTGGSTTMNATGNTTSGTTASATPFSYCMCGKAPRGLMMQCELCFDWFHSACVTLPVIAVVNPSRNFKSTVLQMGYRKCRFLCRGCQRTRRPRLEQILNLLMCLQKLHARLPEGEALQSLTIRAMNWQDRARTLLHSADYHIRDGLTKINRLVNTNTAIIAAKNAASADVNRRIKQIASGCTGAGGHFSSRQKYNHHKSPEKSATSDLLDHLADTGSGSQDESDPDTGEMEDDDPDDDMSGNYKRPYGDSECSIYLPAQVRLKLEELLMEGDLLEVSLDESRQLWQLLIASAETEKPCIIDFDKLRQQQQQQSSTPSAHNRKGRKRRSMELDTIEPLSGSGGGFTSTPRVPNTLGVKRSRGGRGGGAGHPRGSSGPVNTHTRGTRRGRGSRGGPGSRGGGGGGRGSRGGGGRRGGNAVASDKSGGSKEDVAEEDEDEEDEDDDIDEETSSDADAKCAVSSCLQPVGDEVDWVQCDGGCEQWFHMACVGLCVKDINEDEDYICSACSGDTVICGVDSEQLRLALSDDSCEAAIGVVVSSTALCAAAAERLRYSPKAAVAPAAVPVPISAPLTVYLEHSTTDNSKVQTPVELYTTTSNTTTALTVTSERTVTDTTSSVTTTSTQSLMLNMI